MKTFELAGLRDGKWLNISFNKLEAMLSPYSDKKIAVLNIAGEFRTGKSFALNFFLRYLKWQQLGKSGDWLDKNGPAVGQDFEWAHQSKPFTKGFNVWPEVYEIANDTVLLLMDTQGLNDSETGEQGNQLLFIFSTLMASVQILNLREKLTAETIKALHFFVEFANFVEEGATSFFQNLVIWIRDWKYTKDHAHGLNGGNNYLNEFVNGQGVASNWTRVRSVFQEFGAFLMPPPGERVDSPDFQGQINDIKQEFLDQMRVFVEGLIGPNGCIRPKQLKNGQVLTCKQWLEQMKFFSEIFQNQDKLPPAMSMLQALSHYNALYAAFGFYESQMNDKFNTDKEMNEEQLKSFHGEMVKEALKLFDQTKKQNASPEVYAMFRSDLEQKIMKHYDEMVEFVKIRVEKDKEYAAKIDDIEDRRNQSEALHNAFHAANQFFTSKISSMKISTDSEMSEHELNSTLEQILAEAIRVFENTLGRDVDKYAYAKFRSRLETMIQTTKGELLDAMKKQAEMEKKLAKKHDQQIAEMQQQIDAAKTNKERDDLLHMFLVQKMQQEKELEEMRQAFTMHLLQQLTDTKKELEETKNRNELREPRNVERPVIVPIQDRSDCTLL